MDLEAVARTNSRNMAPAFEVIEAPVPLTGGPGNRKVAPRWGQGWVNKAVLGRTAVSLLLSGGKA